MNDETDQSKPVPDGVEREVRSRDERLHEAAEALYSGVLDGLSPSPAAIRDAWDYIEGRRTLDEIIQDVRRPSHPPAGGAPMTGDAESTPLG